MDETGEGAVLQVTGAWGSGRGPGPDYVACFRLSRDYLYLSIVQINHFKPNPSHSANENQSFRSGASTAAWCAHAGGARKKMFRPGPNPISAAMYTIVGHRKLKIRREDRF